MKAIIIDDNDNARAALKSDLEDYCEDINLIGEADGVETGYQLIEKVDPELVFLDIRMGDGTGFDLLEKYKPISDIPFKIIFTTAYDEFALKAFKYAATDYLLKPIDSDSLVEAVSRVTKQNPSDKTEQLQALLKHITKPKSNKISLADAERIHVVNIEEIVRCESFKNYTTFFLLDEKKITVSKTIKEYEEQLNDHDFLRVHHSHLINLNQIKEVIKVDGPYLIMQDGSNVPVSVRKKDSLMKKMKGIW